MQKQIRKFFDEKDKENKRVTQKTNEIQKEAEVLLKELGLNNDD